MTIDWKYGIHTAGNYRRLLGSNAENAQRENAMQE